MFQWRDERQINAIDRSIVLLVRAVTGLAFLGLALRHASTLLPFRPVAAWAPQDWAAAQAGLLAFVAALPFLLPAAFDRLLFVCRAGRLRLLLATGFVLLLPFLAEFALWLGLGRGSPLAGHVTSGTVFLTLAIFALAYLYALVVPGRAFDRVRPIIPEHVFIVPGKPVRLRPDYGALDLARAAMFGGLVLFWTAGIAGMYFLDWLPDPKLISRMESNWFLLAGMALIASLLAFSGPLWGSDESTLRTLVRRGLLVLTSAILTYSLAMPALTRGLPWLHAQITATGAESSNLEVTVLGRKGSGRGQACDRGALVSVPDGGERPVILCSIPAETWKDLQPGDKLVVHGQRTPWGMRYQSIEER